MSFYIDGRRGGGPEEVARLLDEKNREDLREELGDFDFEAKYERWRKVNYPPLGLLDEYPEKISQIINAYSMGYDFVAVTSACCLGERLLNRLVLRTRDHFRKDPDYKALHKKRSFDDWDKMITWLLRWKIIDGETAQTFQKLKGFRHKSIHYNEGYAFDAVTVVNLLIEGLTRVFGVLNRKDIFLVFDIPGEIWVRKDAESLPFVKEFVIPHCYRAHAVHELDIGGKKLEEKLGVLGPLTDAEFISLRNEYLSAAPGA